VAPIGGTARIKGRSLSDDRRSLLTVHTCPRPRNEAPQRVFADDTPPKRGQDPRRSQKPAKEKRTTASAASKRSRRCKATERGPVLSAVTKQDPVCSPIFSNSRGLQPHRASERNTAPLVRPNRPPPRHTHPRGRTATTTTPRAPRTPKTCVLSRRTCHRKQSNVPDPRFNKEWPDRSAAGHLPNSFSHDTARNVERQI